MTCDDTINNKVLALRYAMRSGKYTVRWKQTDMCLTYDIIQQSYASFSVPKRSITKVRQKLKSTKKLIIFLWFMKVTLHLAALLTVLPFRWITCGFSLLIPLRLQLEHVRFISLFLSLFLIFSDTVHESSLEIR
jgi:hypothetical protein